MSHPLTTYHRGSSWPTLFQLVCSILLPGLGRAACTLGGGGTTESPYLVGNYADLKQVGTTCDLGSTYRMTADIDASASQGENNGYGFTPIAGVLDTVHWMPTGGPFTGAFHGSGHVIRNITITPGTSHAGLFMRVSGTSSKIDSLGLVEATISIGDPSGIAGGIVAILDSGAVNNCFVSGSLVSSGSGTVGGIVGWNTGLVMRCYATAEIYFETFSTARYLGGVVGSNGGILQDCYATGNVVGSVPYNGGVVGYNTGLVKSCYYSGPDSTATGGGVAGNNAPGTVLYCYWNQQTSGRTSEFSQSVPGVPTTAGLSSPQMRDSANFVGFGFAPDSAWTIIQGQSFPLLRGLPGGTGPQISAQTAVSNATTRISACPIHFGTAALRHLGHAVDLQLSVSSRVRVIDASGVQVTPGRTFLPGVHALDIPNDRSVLFVQVRAGSSTTTLPLVPVH